MRKVSQLALLVGCMSFLFSCSSSSDDCTLYCSKMFSLNAGGTWHCKVNESIDAAGQCKERLVYRVCEDWYGQSWECSDANQVCFNRSTTAEVNKTDGNECETEDDCAGLICVKENETDEKGVCTLEGVACEDSLSCLSVLSNYICQADIEGVRTCQDVGKCDSGCVRERTEATRRDGDDWIWMTIYNPEDEVTCQDQCDLNTAGDPMPEYFKTDLESAKSVYDFQDAQLQIQCRVSSSEM